MNLNAAKKLLSNPNFTNWFGNSKVIDDTGAPMKVYHGTNNFFDAFDPRYTQGQMGFHFGSKDAASSIYGDTPPQNIMENYLSLQNPLRLDDLGAWQGADVVNMVNKKLGTNIHQSASDAFIKDTIMKHGYDGVVYGNKFENGIDDAIQDSYIAFKPTQIKSTSNRGTFDPKDPNILKGAAAAIGAASALAGNNAYASQWKNFKSDEEGLQDSYNPLDMAIAAATGGATLTLKAAAAALDPIIDTVSRQIFGE
jgi:hypothetical protein